jgi:outer membrane protein TolC
MKFLILLIISNSAMAAQEFIPTLKKLIELDPSFKEIENLQEYNQLVEKSSLSKLIIPDVSFSYSKSKDEVIGTNIEVNSELTRLNLRYSLFSFGSYFKEFKSNQYGHNSYKASLDLTFIEREEKIANLLFNEIRYKQSLDIQNEIIKLKENGFKIAKAKYTRGSLSKNDLTRVNLDLINSKSEIINLKQEIAAITIELNGLDPNIKNEFKVFPWSNFFSKHGLKRINKIQFKPENTPLSQKYKNFSIAQEERANSEFLKHLGSFSVNYSRDLYQQEDSQDAYGWSASLVYTLPLFENFNRQKEVQQAKASARTAKSYYLYYKNIQNKDIDSKIELLKISYEVFKDRLNTLKDSEMIFKNVLKRFNKGLISVNDLFIEQDRLLTTKRLTNTAVYNLHKNYLSVIHRHGLSITKMPELVK